MNSLDSLDDAIKKLNSVRGIFVDCQDFSRIETAIRPTSQDLFVDMEPLA
uniref:Uncharacterized protein n=1 Tax=Anguilla anguilla TaxID=7936 RepID=A0A0E9QL69_ANGAN